MSSNPEWRYSTFTESVSSVGTKDEITTKYYYDSDGNRLKTIDYDIDGNMVGWCEYIY
ncbi:MAG: hypothetical protein IJO85_08230 [Lachnospiraceae bacterium]|nr:hypothetical protein [Lachnospiraceae bacterium]